MAAIGEARGTVPSGCKAGSRLIWAGRSGLAFSSTQRTPSALNASEAWVRGLTSGSPALARWQLAQPQFHCGKPPPAAAPSTFTRIA